MFKRKLASRHNCYDNLSTMKNTFEQDWKEAFDSYKNLPEESRMMLRGGAADALIERGAEEVGSSDVNHELFSEWKINDRSWDKVLKYYYHNVSNELQAQAFLKAFGVEPIE